MARGCLTRSVSWSAAAEGTSFAVPFFIFQGGADEHTLTSLAREYFAVVEAPEKSLVLLPGGGHCAVLMQPDVFLGELRARVSAAQTVERGSAGRP